MYFYCVFGAVFITMTFVHAWKRAIKLYRSDLLELRGQIQDSLDYDTNELKQSRVAAIDLVFEEYSHNKNI